MAFCRQAALVSVGIVCFGQVEVLVLWILSSTSLPSFFYQLQDEATSICEASVWLREADWEVTFATHSNVHAYVEKCRSIFENGTGELFEHLRRSQRAGQVESCLANYEETAYIAMSGEACAAPYGYKDDAKGGPEGSHMALYRRTGLRPLQERLLPASEARLAFSRAEVAKFDATPFLPTGILNMTMQNLHALNVGGPEISVHSTVNQMGHDPCIETMRKILQHVSHSGPRSALAVLAKYVIFPFVLWHDCRTPPTLTEAALHMQLDAELPPEEMWPSSEQWSQGEFLAAFLTGRTLFSSNINLRRLPSFPPIDFVGPLGLSSDDVEHVHSLLWIGASGGGFHRDRHDNVLVELTGNAEVVIIPANCSWRVPRQVGAHSSLTLLHWLTEGMPNGTSRLPFFHIALRPGEGVIIPSNSLHAAWTYSSRRLAVNAFLEPRFQSMQWPGAPANSYANSDKTYLAVRALFMKTIKALWDEQRIGMALHNFRQELI